MDSIYITPEHEALREQVARFIAREVEPHAALWEEQGHVPRGVLRRMGAAGLFGLMYDEAHGGAGADANSPPVGHAAAHARGGGGDGRRSDRDVVRGDGAAVRGGEGIHLR